VGATMLERLPTVLSAQEVLDKAFHHAAKIEIPDPVKYHRVRKEMVARIQSVSDTVHATLERYVKGVPNLDHLRDYEAEILDIVLGLNGLRRAVKRIDWAAEKALDLGREHTQRASRLRSIEAFHDLLKRHYGRLSSVVYDVDDALSFLAAGRDRMRLLPTVSPDFATVVIAGFPNVGKTSLLRSWTQSRAEVNSYPFTTKRAEVGHFEVDAGADVRKVQVVDTPGLLDRPDEERNDVERQAAAALRHAADAVLFLLDPSETSGYSLAQQERLLAQVGSEMAGMPLLVAETKADVFRSGSGRPCFSTHTGEGLDELRALILRMLPEDRELEIDPLSRWEREG